MPSCLRRSASLSFSLSLASFVAILGLTGCGIGTPAAPSPVAGAAFTGHVHGGQNPVSGAHVHLMAAGTSGYGAASTALTLSGGLTDSIGSYVLSDANGNFSLDTVNGSSTTYAYTCPTATTQVYLYATGGNPGAGPNSALGLMAALGPCGNLSSSTVVVVNEVTTIATAYALAAFAVDPLHIADDEGVVGNTTAALAKLGMANAFATVNNLVYVAGGSALATTPAGNGTVPQATINTLANILATCVNSADVYVSGNFSSISSNCSTLFGYATANGLPTGTQPTDSAGVAINIAHYPGVNVASIFGVPTPSAPFAPALTSTQQPNDFTLQVGFSGTVQNDGVAFVSPHGIVVDGSDDIWYADGIANTAVKLSNLGVPASGSPFAVGSGPDGIAVDNSGSVWVLNGNDSVNGIDSTVSKLSSAGVAATGSPFTVGEYAIDAAIDATGNIWVANGNDDTVSELSSAGTNVGNSPIAHAGVIPYGIAIDTSGNVWIADSGGSQGNNVSKLTSAGVQASGSPFTVSGARYLTSVALDSAGNVWLNTVGATQSRDYEFSSSFSAVTGSPFTVNGITGFTPGLFIDGLNHVWNGSIGQLGELNAGATVTGSPYSVQGSTVIQGGNSFYVGSIAVDGSGNLWTLNINGTPTVTEFIGLAAPVVTPLAAALVNNKLGTRP